MRKAGIINPFLRPNGLITRNSYDRMISTELVPWAQHETGFERMAFAGCSFGGYHAVNTAFRHPNLASYCFSMSGAFDIKQFTDGYYNDTILFQ